MESCLRKLFTSPEEDEEDDRTTTAFAVPVAEVYRNAESATALVITHSHFKFSVMAVYNNNNNNSTLAPTLEYRDDDLSYHQMKAGFQHDCKPFTWHFPEL